MSQPGNVLFSSDLWKRALEKYAIDTHLSVKLFDAEERVVFGPVNSTPLFNLFDERGYDPGIFAECAHRCMVQTNGRPAVMVSQVYGLAVVGTSLALGGKVVGAAVGGYAFVDFSQLSEVQRLAKDAGIKFERLWKVAREQKPVPHNRLMLSGELLQVLGDALLRENFRTRQYEDSVLKLEVTASAKAAAHHELQQTASALRESEERLANELRAAHQLQSVSAMFIEGGDLQGLYQKIVDTAAALMQSDFASLQMLDGGLEHPGELRLLAQRGFSPKATAFWEWVRLNSESSCGAALRNAHRIVIGNVETCDFMAGTADLENYREAGMKAVQSTPLLSRTGQLLGMLSTHWRAPHLPTEDALRGFDVLARQAADVLERNGAEEKLRRIAEFDETVMVNMGEGLYTVSNEGMVTSMNPAAEKLLGWTFAEMQGRKMHDQTHHHHPDGTPFPAEECADLRVLKQGEPLTNHEDVFIRKDGTFFPVVISSAPLRSASGEISGLVVVFRDITERKQAELATREQQERLRQVEKMAAAGQLAASMAHEINNPLSSVTNSLYLLEKRANLDESARFFVTTAASELARVSRIVKQSLSHYRVGTTPRDLDLGEIVNESLQIFSVKIQNAGIELKPKIHNGTVLVGFPDELRQVIDNLLLNALEAMPRGGRLNISVHDSFEWKRQGKHSNGVRLTIADTGCGIPKEHRLRIFEPFFTTKAEKGTGLGLWILQGIIAKHDGIMSLRSSDAKDRSGTIVSIFLPSHARRLRKVESPRAEPAA